MECLEKAPMAPGRVACTATGMLMLGRFLVAGGRALDLATGSAIRWRTRRANGALPPLFDARGDWWLIDFDLRGHSRVEAWERWTDRQAAGCDGAAVETLRAVLADARDGRPRAIDLVEPSAPTWAVTMRTMAREARLAGFVPLSADALGAVLKQARWRWPAWMADRSLVIFATDARISADAGLALFRLATRDPRPHVVVRSVTAALGRPAPLVLPPGHLHEGLASSTGDAGAGGVAESTNLLPRVEALVAAGQLTDAEAVARWSVLLSGAGRDSAARCALARCLLAQRRVLEARAVIRPVSGPAAAAIQAELQTAPADTRVDTAALRAFGEILRTCQEIEDERLALSRVSGLIRETSLATGVAFVALHGTTPTALVSAGALPPGSGELEVARSAIDTGVAVSGPATSRSPDMAWPVRYGAAIVGALWCRWATGLPLLPRDVESLMSLAARATAPALHALVERARIPHDHEALIPELVGKSAQMQAVRAAIVRAAAAPFAVLIEGESGAGKELVARAIHAASLRRGRRFCPLNCAALADELVEAELFGHARGAFTGAVAERAGLFEEAHGGTLFLDEVAELGPRVQAKLLRVLQEHEIRRVGESSVRKVDTRIVAATNRPLAEEAAAGRFRHDLRYRLEVVRIVVPPLRDRIEDLPALARHVWAGLSARTGSRAVLSPAVIERLAAHDWPGNVRELHNVLATLMVAGPARGVIGPQGLPAHLTGGADTGVDASLAEARRAFDARFVRAALSRAGGRTAAAASVLGVSRQGLLKLMARLQLEPATPMAPTRR